MGRAVIINLTDEQLEKLGELVDIEVKDDSDVEFAIKTILEKL